MDYDASVYLWVGFCNGYVFGYGAILLTVGAAIGLFLRPAPRGYSRLMEGLAIVMLVSSTITLVEYLVELWMGLTATNEFAVMLFRQRFSGYLAVSYAVSLAAALMPQLFWWRRFRRSFMAILIIAIAANAGTALDRLMIAVSSSQQEFLPESWAR